MSFRQAAPFILNSADDNEQGDKRASVELWQRQDKKIQFWKIPAKTLS
jgi:hypothetical protein